jgi:hypothetical protein
VTEGNEVLSNGGNEQRSRWFVVDGLEMGLRLMGAALGVLVPNDANDTHCRRTDGRCLTYDPSRKLYTTEILGFAHVVRTDTPKVYYKK